MRGKRLVARVVSILLLLFIIIILYLRWYGAKTSRRRPRGYSKRKANFIVLDRRTAFNPLQLYTALTIPLSSTSIFHIPKQNIIVRSILTYTNQISEEYLMSDITHISIKAYTRVELFSGQTFCGVPMCHSYVRSRKH